MFTPHDVSFDATVLGNLSSINHNTASTLQQAFASGGTSPSAQYLAQQSPATTLQTTALERLLGLNSNLMISSGLCVSSATSTIPFRELEGCGTGSASHQSLSTTNLFAFINSISAQLTQPATADVELRYISTDGNTPPITVNSGASLSAAVLLSEFLLAEVYIDGVLIDEVTGVTVNPGITIVEKRQGTGTYPTQIIAKAESASIEITTQNLVQANALVNGAATSTGVDIYLAKRAHGSRTELFTATEHIKISSTAGLKQTQSISTTREDGSGVIKVDLSLPSSGDQVLLAATTGVAITV